MGKPLLIALFLLFLAAAGLYTISKTPQWLEPFSGSWTGTSTLRTSPTLRSYAPYSFQGGAAKSSGSGYLPSVSDWQIPKGFTRADLSPFFGKVRVSSAYGAFTVPEIRLYSTLASGETLNVSGWKLKSNHGEIVLTQAIHSYDPSGFDPAGDILLRRYHTVVVSGGVSPLSRNFRLNKCIGYLNNLYSFNPPLPQTCPRPEERNILYLSGECQNYVRSLPSCAVPNPTRYNQFPGTNEGNACRNFLNGISYRGCYEAHQKDADFSGNEWRLWVNQNILDPQHDLVRLYDAQGFLVDHYQY